MSLFILSVFISGVTWKNIVNSLLLPLVIGCVRVCVYECVGPYLTRGISRLKPASAVLYPPCLQRSIWFLLPCCFGFITKNDTIVWYSFWSNQHLRHDIPHCIRTVNYKLEFHYGIKDKVKGSQIWRVGRPTFTCIQLPLCCNYNFERSPSDAEERQHLNESLAVAVWPWGVDLSCTTLLMSKKMLCIFGLVPLIVFFSPLDCSLFYCKLCILFSSPVMILKAGLLSKSPAEKVIRQDTDYQSYC